MGAGGVDVGGVEVGAYWASVSSVCSKWMSMSSGFLLSIIYVSGPMKCVTLYYLYVLVARVVIRDVVTGRGDVLFHRRLGHSAFQVNTSIFRVKAVTISGFRGSHFCSVC